ncbi:hypothetical protein [Kitasatospora sp. NPDC015120]|uniref:hypothetical protein n=1 Tax=Kitasatospora sp. NPDC015120 TaxID=3364023 RepID=UPI0036F48A45
MGQRRTVVRAHDGRHPEPGRDRDHTRSDRKSGDEIHVPEPFGFALSPAALVPYKDRDGGQRR